MAPPDRRLLPSLCRKREKRSEQLMLPEFENPVSDNFFGSGLSIELMERLDFRAKNHLWSK